MLACQVRGKLGRDTARTAEPNWPEGYSVPYEVVLSMETGAAGRGAAIAARGGVCVVHWVVSNCSVHSLFCNYYYC